MTQITFLAGLLSALLLAACGGSGGTADDTPAPEATAVGHPIGRLGSSVIGTAGGTLRSADGSVEVEVPPGAFGRDETLTLQEISNEAHGAPGRAWRITPEGLKSAVPMTLRFRYTDADLQGSEAGQLRIAYQDARRRWIIPAAPVLDTTARTVSVQTTHFSDWSLLRKLWLAPLAATVQVGQPLKLAVYRCEVVGFDAGEDGGDPQLVKDCEADPQTLLPDPDAPQVNGVKGGNAQVGTAVQPDWKTAEFQYTAPAQVPTPRTVAFSVEVFTHDDETDQASTYLVSNITIEDRDCAWIQGVQFFDYAVKVDAYTVGASAENASYTGSGRLDVTGRLKRITPAGQAVSVFASADQPAAGLVAVSGTLTVTDPTEPYVQSYAASGAPSGLGLQLPPSAFVLAVDHASCTYAFGGGAITHGRIEGGPGANADALMTPGALHFKNMPIAEAAEQAQAIEVTSIAAPFALDDQVNGYNPWTSLRTLNFDAGGTTASWRLQAAAP